METDKQKNNRPWLWKKGQSGNPAGRPKGITMKEYAKQYLACMNDEERDAFMDGLPKETIWRMAEGNPHQTQEHSGEVRIGKPIDEPNEIRQDTSIQEDKATES